MNLTTLTNMSLDRRPQTLATGGVLAFGESAEGDSEHPHNAGLIAAGHLVAADTRQAHADEDLDDLTVDELQNRVNAAGVDVVGTGHNGRVLKGDLVAALRAHSA